MLNITTFLDANARRLDKDVFYFPSRDLRYNSAEILSIISGIGQSLKDKGIEKGDRVLIYLNKSPEYLFSLFGIWRIGAIAIPTNRILTAAELNYMIDDSDAKLIITDEDAKEILFFGTATNNAMTISIGTNQTIGTITDSLITSSEKLLAFALKL